jgi:hypothetical protein
LGEHRIFSCVAKADRFEESARAAVGLGHADDRAAYLGERSGGRVKKGSEGGAAELLPPMQALDLDLDLDLERWRRATALCQ